VLVGLVFSVALAARPTLGDGWYWEVGNGLGFLALVLIFVLTLHGRGGLGGSSEHRWLGIGVFFAVFGHALWFLVGDSVVWEYLRWGAPHYMVAGVLSAGLLLLVTFSSVITFRNESYAGYPSFQRWHRYLSVAILITAIVHVLLSGFYIIYLWQMIALVTVAFGAYMLPTMISVDASFGTRNLGIVCVIALIVYCVLRVGISR